MAESGTTSLYVGDLETNVTETQLFNAFSQSGLLQSVKVCRDLATGRSLGYGYVTYICPQYADRAIQELNFMMLNGKLIRVMYCHKDLRFRRANSGNIFIKNLEKSIDSKVLHDTFSMFGTVLSCRVATDASGQSKGYGFVHYENEQDAQRAIEQLNGLLFNDKQVFVGPYLRRHERQSTIQKTGFTSVYVKNLSNSTADNDLRNVFGEFGRVTSAAVIKDEDGKSKCFGFVNFENAKDADRAVESLNETKFDGKKWYVRKARKKYESLSQAIPVQALASALANATPEQQRTMVGESLYRLVQRLEPEAAAKVTGMFLEMDHSEVFHLLESHDALRSKLAEAIQVLATSIEAAPH